VASVVWNRAFLPDDQTPSGPERSAPVDFFCYLMKMVANALCREMDKDTHRSRPPFVRLLLSAACTTN
jgi:hypothetical protein